MKACPNQQKLVLLADGELPADERRVIRAHLAVCPDCESFFALLYAATDALAVWGQAKLPVEVVEAAEEVLAVRLRENQPEMPEIMTLPEVMDFLRLTPEEANEVLPELPMFELAGQLRLRRSALLAWIGERETRYKHEQVKNWGRRAANGVA